MDDDLKSALRSLAREALEAELRGPLSELAEAFDQWKLGVMDSLTLDGKLYAFENGPRNDLFSLYEGVGSASLDYVVARAINRNLLQRDRVSPEVLDHLAVHLRFVV